MVLKSWQVCQKQNLNQKFELGRIKNAMRRFIRGFRPVSAKEKVFYALKKKKMGEREEKNKEKLLALGKTVFKNFLKFFVAQILLILKKKKLLHN